MEESKSQTQDSQVSISNTTFMLSLLSPSKPTPVYATTIFLKQLGETLATKCDVSSGLKGYYSVFGSQSILEQLDMDKPGQANQVNPAGKGLLNKKSGSIMEGDQLEFIHSDSKTTQGSDLEVKNILKKAGFVRSEYSL